VESFASLEEATSLAKLIYIGGYGRSGSTLLEYLLADDGNVVACGEVARHLHTFRARRTCTCGREAKECPVWGRFQLGPEAAQDWDHRRLTLAMLDHVSAHYAVMVDSSKTAWGSWSTPFRLRQRLGSDFLLVHLVRDPRAVCWSTIKTRMGRSPLKRDRRRTTPAGRCFRTALGWMAANLSCEIFGWLYPRQYLRFRYEDFARAPEQVLEDILARVATGVPRGRRRAEPEDNRHQLYGNRTRFRPVSGTRLEEDVAWKSAMPKGYRWLALSLSWPLALRYGYFGR
jgi:hypothetical protein